MACVLVSVLKEKIVPWLKNLFSRPKEQEIKSLQENQISQGDNSPNVKGNNNTINYR
jgi:hypothetical protein